MISIKLQQSESTIESTHFLKRNQFNSSHDRYKSSQLDAIQRLTNLNRRFVKDRSQIQVSTKATTTNTTPDQKRGSMLQPQQFHLVLRDSLFQFKDY